MKSNAHKNLVVNIKKAQIDGIKYNHTVFMYSAEKTSFVGSFKFILPRLHEILFNEIIIIFYRIKKNKKRLLGIIKIKLKQFILNDFNKNQTFDISNPSYLHKSDFYDRNFISIGSAVINFKVQKNVEDKVIPTVEQKDSILNMFFEEEKIQMYKIAYEIFSATQKGTFFCRVYWILGLISADYYYTYCYGECKNEMCLNGQNNCDLQFCKSTYGMLKREEIDEVLQILQYAAASFADSIITWKLEKTRNLTNVIKDSRKRAILERLDVADTELVRDFPGNHNSLAFIAFFTQDKLVLSFKGTTSVTEALHDLNCDYAEFQDGYVHRGIKILCDRWIASFWEGLRDEMNLRNVKKLLLTGQSLGGAASILIYLRMKEIGIESVFDIDVVCFGSPPVLSASIARRPFPKIKNYFYGTDFISRLNYGSILDLKYICISISSLYDYFVDKALIVQKIAEIKQYLSETAIHTKLYHPGTLIHIRDFGESGKPDVLYKKVDCVFFEEIICSRQAPFDHFIHRTMNALRSSLKKYDSA